MEGQIALVREGIRALMSQQPTGASREKETKWVLMVMFKLVNRFIVDILNTGLAHIESRSLN